MTPVLITGCPMSGTKWLADALTRLGVPCSHEVCYPAAPGVERLPLLNGCEVSCAAVPFLSELPSDVCVVRLVRNPLHVYRSMLAHPTFLRSHTKGNSFLSAWGYEVHLDPAQRSNQVARLVVDWDAPVAGRAIATVRAEAGAETVRTVALVAGCIFTRRRAEEVCEALDKRSIRYHSHGGQLMTRVGWDDAPELVPRALALGYEVRE